MIQGILHLEIGVMTGFKWERLSYIGAMMLTSWWVHPGSRVRIMEGGVLPSRNVNVCMILFVIIIFSSEVLTDK